MNPLSNQHENLSYKNASGMNLLNLTMRSDRDPNHRRESVALEVLTFTIICPLNVLGNILVCTVIYRSRRVQSTTNYFIASLACSDLCFATFCMPFIFRRAVVDRWLLGDGLCKAVRFGQYLLPGVSMYVLVSVSIDRFYTIVYPLSFRVTRTKAKKMVLANWVASCVTSSLTVHFFERDSLENSTVRAGCPSYIPSTPWTGTLYASSITALHYIIPAVTILTAYGRISRYIRKSGEGGRTFRRPVNPVSRTKAKILKMLVIASGCTVLFLTPFYVVQAWCSFGDGACPDSRLFTTAVWFVYASGVAKPAVYLRYNPNFRRGCKELLCMSTMKCYRSNTYAITTPSVLGKKNYVGIVDAPPHGVAMESPRQTFDRATFAEKVNWPINRALSTTYL